MNDKRVAGFAQPAVIAVSLLIAACSGGQEGGSETSDSAASGAAIIVQGFVYTPSPLEVNVSTRVTWTNRDDILHTATSGTPAAPTGLFDGEMKGPGATFSHRFDEPGRYQFFCARHNGMTGQVVVTP